MSDGGGDESATLNQAKIPQSRESYSGSVSLIGIGSAQGGKIPLGTDAF